MLTGHRYVGVNALEGGSQISMSASSGANTTGEGVRTFLDARHALVTRGGKKALGAGVVGLSGSYGEKDTYTGFKNWERPTLIDYILLADNAAVIGGSAKSQEGSGSTGDEGGEKADEHAKGSAGWSVTKYGVLPNHFGDGVWVSDHRMVVVTLRQA